MYEYTFDHTPAGGYGPRRADYILIHDALKLLVQKLESWNGIALQNGALSAPYRREVEDLKGMIDWGEEQLANLKLTEIRDRGVSVGSFRYMKAALLHAKWHHEKEIAATAKAQWPSAVIDSVRGKIRRLHELAGHLAYPPADILNELGPEYGTFTSNTQESAWDAFLSHASEDKAEIVLPLAEALKKRGLNVWYDDFALTVGDSLRRSIDRGLARSKFGIVVLSQKFFEKEWPQKELDGLVARELNGVKVILPVWHGITAEEVRKFSPTLADRVGISSSAGLDSIITALLAAMGR
jgi:hypothetical protein